MLKATTVLAGALSAAVATAAAAEGELNIYSSRHYDTDEQLYSEFEEATGITINRIEGNADELIARMNAEGENSPGGHPDHRRHLPPDPRQGGRRAAKHRQRRAGNPRASLPAG